GTTKTLTKAEFTQAWGVPASQLIQPTTTNDMSGPRPTSGTGGNLPQGGITGSGLANGATNDGNDANDLVNTPFDPTYPCAYHQPLCVSPAPDNEVELLVDNTGQIIDKVNYGVGGTSPNRWPASTNGISIYLKPGYLNATANDVGDNWAQSAVGTSGAYQSSITGNLWTSVDTGSPGFVDDGSTLPPVAVSKVVPTQKASPVGVTLEATGGTGSLTYRVLSLPAHGTPKDSNGNAVVVGNPLPGTTVTYEGTGGFTGSDSFTYKATDTIPKDSNTATVTFMVQDGTVVITEIMYNPQNYDGSSNEWEWVEIYNGGPSPVVLGGIGTSFPPAKPANLGSAQIQPGQVLILARDANPTDVPTHTQEAFLNEWALVAGQVVFVPFADWSVLGNSSGANVYLTDSSGGLLDMVAYGVANPWPTSTNGPSIYVTEGFTNTADNDNGTNWALSAVGVAGAKKTGGNDIGSPLYVPGVTIGNQAPYASGQTVWTARNRSWDITLAAQDDGLPDPPKQLTYVIEAPAPTLGTLYDIDNGVAITSYPYTIPNNKKRVRYTAGAACGNDSFKFHVNDGEFDSNSATVNVWVQCGDLIITEVMYNPASAETTPKVTEWIEVYNTTDIAIDATGWYITKGTSGATSRSGDWPSTAIIPAHGVAVIVPPGSGARTMDAAQFRAAWDGYDVPVIIVPTATNDSAAGELAASGLANSPAYPGEMLRIIDLSGRVQDIVSYRDGSGWPGATGESSIYLKPGNYTAGDNDSGANWGNSRSCAGGAYGCKVTGVWDKTDFGSPGFLEGQTCGSNNLPPTPLWRRVGILMNTPTLVTLTYCDDGNPVAGPVTCTITAMPAPDPALPAHGTLTDPANNHVIVESDLPYTLLNHGNQVLYTPNPDYTSAFGGPDGKTDTGDYFSFAVNDGEKDSRADGHIALVVQKGQLILSEIMYDPAHLNANPVTGDSDWEWLEVTNVSGTDVTLSGITDTIGEPDSLFYVGASIPAGATRVIAPDNAGRTQQEFLNAWGLDSSSVIFVYGWETLVNSGDRLQLIDDTGALQDEVYYGGSTSGPWMDSNNQSSIYVRYGKLNAIDNDQG
ncbi:MAG TPA: lamin tail domain-containing protein, partial [Phycisphaerae bacterium]|nr:lamin tail domain-containing protein [Phycisphaerae bacterium]